MPETFGAVSEVTVALPHQTMPDADWADGWQVRVERPFENARLAAEAIIAAFPVWTTLLLAMRQVLVLPFGLKGAGSRHDIHDMINIFPVVSQDTNRLVAGFNDKHLDFRIVVDTGQAAPGQTVTLTTVIKRHNRLGRAYLAMVLPFHRAIIRSALARAARRR